MKAKVHTVVLVMVYALAILSIAAGIPKVLRMPQELEFLSAIGFFPAAVLALGILQVLGGVLLVLKKTRLPGLMISGACLLLSSVALFAGGNSAFGLISLLPFAISVFLLFYFIKNR